MDFIILLFFIYLDDSRVKKFGGINMLGHLVVGPSLENWGLELFGSI
jgi:hypothetical protein